MPDQTAEQKIAERLGGVEITPNWIIDHNYIQREASPLEFKLYDLCLAFQREKDELEKKPHPKIVCLCGSTRFKDTFDEANYQETMAGRIVLSVGFYMHVTGNRHGEGIGATPEQKIALDELHKRKIDLADEVFVLNVDGYIGESTRSEIDYAIAHKKSVKYLEPLTEAHPND